MRRLVAALCLASCGPLPREQPTREPARTAEVPSAPVAATRQRPERPCLPDPDEPPERRADLGYEREELKKPFRFGPFTCAPGRELWRDEKGRVRVCTVMHRVKAFDIELAADAYTHFHENGRPYQTTIALPHNLRTASGVTVPCAADLVVLTPDGALEHCKLAADRELDGVPCKGGESAAFHPSGKLAGATLSRAFERAGMRWPAAVRIELGESGAVRGGHLPEPLDLGGLSARSTFTLHDNGAPFEVTLADKATIDGHELPAWATVWLRRDGSLYRSKHEAAHGFMPHGERWHDTRHTRYDCRGKVVFSHDEHYQAPSRPRPPRH